MQYSNLLDDFSVHHEYEGEWSNTTRLISCDPRTNRSVTSSSNPQEVIEKQEIIFTYDVSFEVTFKRTTS